MTIKVEREALLRVLERQPSHPALAAPISDDDAFLLIDFRKPLSPDDDPVESLRCSMSDDDDSVFTVSTASLSDSDSSDLIERRVSFAEDLVTNEWTRDFTPKDEVAKLFYSTEDTQRFRQEYRMERKLLSELSIDPETFSVDNVEELCAAVSSCQPSSLGRHLISRVVVLHNDKLETFFNPDQPECPKVVPNSDVFFDSDSFWSGSITWY